MIGDGLGHVAAVGVEDRPQIRAERRLGLRVEAEHLDFRGVGGRHFGVTHTTNTTRAEEQGGQVTQQAARSRSRLRLRSSSGGGRRRGREGEGSSEGGGARPLRREIWAKSQRDRRSAAARSHRTLTAYPAAKLCRPRRFFRICGGGDISLLLFVAAPSLPLLLLARLSATPRPRSLAAPPHSPLSCPAPTSSRSRTHSSAAVSSPLSVRIRE